MSLEGGRIPTRSSGATAGTSKRSPRGSAPYNGSRVVGIDVARGFAIIGMFAAHAIPRPDEAELLVDGRPSILFATLAGVSLGIMTGSARPLERGRRSDRVVGILIRAAILFVLGVMLSALDSEVAVILDFYAVMFVLVTPVLFFPRWALGALAAVFAVVAPALSAVVSDADRDAPALIEMAQYYLLTGNYPALIWLPFLLVGLITARSGLGRVRTQVWMLSAGTAAAVLGYGTAALLPGVSAAAHSGSTAEVVGSGGFAIAFIGVLLWLTSPERARLRRGRALGQLADRRHRLDGAHHLHAADHHPGRVRRPARQHRRRDRLPGLAAVDRHDDCVGALRQPLALFPRQGPARTDARGRDPGPGRRQATAGAAAADAAAAQPSPQQLQQQPEPAAAAAGAAATAAGSLSRGRPAAAVATGRSGTAACRGGGTASRPAAR